MIQLREEQQLTKKKKELQESKRAYLTHFLTTLRRLAMIDTNSYYALLYRDVFKESFTRH